MTFFYACKQFAVDCSDRHNSKQIQPRQSGVSGSCRINLRFLTKKTRPFEKGGFQYLIGEVCYFEPTMNFRGLTGMPFTRTS